MRRLSDCTFARALAALSIVVAVGCARDDGADVGDGRASAAIINGVIDTMNPASVALRHETTDLFAACSGTIVRVEPPWAWVLTAAHCVNSAPKLVTLGHLNAPVATFYVIEEMVNSAYTGHETDYAILRVIGADANTPFVPIATANEDTLSVGSPITLVGYGRIENMDLRSERRSIDRSVLTLDANAFSFSQNGGGICFGDSGGAAYANLPQGRRVVGVSTLLDNSQCTNWAASARASAAYAPFLRPRIEKATFDSCGQCFARGGLFGPICEQRTQACYQDGTECEAFASCRSACSDQACIDTCAATYPSGSAEYQAVFDCACDACSPVCDEESVCGATPGCGFVSNDSDCNTCTEGCCSEARACADDEACNACFPDCQANASADALWQCLDTANCIGTCGLDVTAGFTGAGGMGGGGSVSSSVSAASVGVGSGGNTTVSSGAGVGGADAATTGGGGAAPGAGDDDEQAAAGGCTIGNPPHRDPFHPSLLGVLVAGLAARRVRRRADRPRSRSLFDFLGTFLPPGRPSGRGGRHRKTAHAGARSVSRL